MIKPLLGWVDKCGRTLVAANITTLCPNRTLHVYMLHNALARVGGTLHVYMLHNALARVGGTLHVYMLHNALARVGGTPTRIYAPQCYSQGWGGPYTYICSTML